MITYELCFLFRNMPKTELVTAVKRSATSILEKGGILRKLEFLGTREMPYKTRTHGLVHKSASYFLFHANIPPSVLEKLSDEFGRDIDIIRKTIIKQEKSEEFECTLHEELAPAPYRKSVQNLIRESKKHGKTKFKYNTGLDYYPFQK